MNCFADNTINIVVSTYLEKAKNGKKMSKGLNQTLVQG